MLNWHRFASGRENFLIASSAKSGGLCLLLVASVAACLAEPTGERPVAELDQAFARLYNTDFRGAHTHLDRYISAEPADPLGYAMRASAYSFSELDRLGILEGEFFGDDKRIAEKRKLRPDPAVRVQFFRAIEDARARAEKTLIANPNDQNALFAMAVTQGVVMDYTALVDKRQLSSLSSARSANDYAQRLIKLNPQFIDAYLTTGLSEYLVGSLPFYIRWFVHFDGVDGSKTRGIENLQLVARSGHYLRPFAKILLAIVYMREKQLHETQKLLVALTAEYPENPLLRKELAKVSEDVGRGGTDGK
jgi:tetratricopeptide (TPR) repeat protein